MHWTRSYTEPLSSFPGLGYLLEGSVHDAYDDLDADGLLDEEEEDEEDEFPLSISRWLQMEDEDGDDYFVDIKTKVRREDPEEPEDYWYWIWDEVERHYLFLDDDERVIAMDENFELVEDEDEEELSRAKQAEKAILAELSRAKQAEKAILAELAALSSGGGGGGQQQQEEEQKVNERKLLEEALASRTCPSESFLSTSARCLL
jgi:hypothetical protein